MIEYIEMNVVDTLMLYFVFVMTAQHIYYNFSHRQKYRYYRIKHV